jgi:cytoskeletal protein RodZ
MDDELVETDVPTVGERLRAAREAKGISLEDIAAQTRIPRRHLESLEVGNWAALPAATYTIGFARSYAGMVELDRAEIADQMRSEMGGQRPAMAAAEVFEPVDPARTMPKWLVFGAIGAVVLLVLIMTWLSNRSLDQPDQVTNVAAAENAPPAQPAAQPAPAAQQAVVLTAIQPVWVQVYEKGGATLFSGMMTPGQAFAVPATATAPLLKTGKPEALQIKVGNAVAPPVGPPATIVADISLLPADLMKAGQAADAPAAPGAAPGTPAPRPTPAQSRRQRAAAPQPQAPVPAPQPAPTTTNTGK